MLHHIIPVAYDLMVSIDSRLSLLHRVSAEPVVEALDSESSPLGHQPCQR